MAGPRAPRQRPQLGERAREVDQALREAKRHPRLDVQKPPLAGLLEVIEVRNQILHSNLKPNIDEVVVPMKGTYDRGHVSITDDPSVDARAIVDTDFGLKAALQPDRARGHYFAVVKVLRAVLPCCNPDPFGLVAALIRHASEEEGSAPAPAAE